MNDAEHRSINLESVTGLLRTRATRNAWYGLIWATCSLVLATMLATYIADGELTLTGMIKSQQSNPALWFLDITPLLFMLFGQYVGVVMSYHAGAMVLDETRALRERAAMLEYELTRGSPEGPNLQLPGRAALISELNTAIRIARDQRTIGAVLVLDTRQYDELAQSQGNAAADEFSRQIARRLGTVVGDDVLLAHLGHDDFAIVLTRIKELDTPQRLAQRIQLALDTPITIEREPLTAHVAIGIALYPNHAHDADTLLRHAESAKFAAEAEGRDFMVYAPELRSERGELLRLSADLHAALYNDGLGADFATQTPLADETGLRLRMMPYWPHPRRGRLDADEFLNVSGRPSLTHTLAVWLLREGLAWLVKVRQSPKHAGIGLIVELPDAAVGQRDLTDRIARLIGAHDLPGDALTIEISERGLLMQPDQTRVQLGMIRDSGINICLTGMADVGTSPAALVEYPINQVRLGRRCLPASLGDARHRTLLEKTIEAAQALDVDVIASNVNDEDELALARTLGCRWAEGPYLTEHLTSSELVNWTGSTPGLIGA